MEESGEQVQMQMEQSQGRETDRAGGLSDRRVESGNKAGARAAKGARMTTTQLPGLLADRWGDVCGCDPQNTFPLEHLNFPSADEAGAQQCGRVQHRTPLG